MRAEFSDKVKKALASRVAWRCSFLGCKRITIGPGHENKEDFVVLGEAAHIYAASDNGPRPNPSMTLEERASSSNGIWMCKMHARLIDMDTVNYSAETLIQWKKNAEAETYKKLQNLDREIETLPQTLISIDNLIFSGIWQSVIDEVWVFELVNFIEGDSEKLKSFVIDFERLPTFSKFVVIESQGDGRQLQKISWKLTENNKFNLSCWVLPKSPRTDPEKMGSDIAMDDDYDMLFENGNLVMIHGVDAAIQAIKITLSSKFGDFIHNPLIGSLFSLHFQRFKNNQELLNSVVKLEIIRLLTVPITDSLNLEATPIFNFINRVLHVQVADSTEKGFVIVSLQLEWGSGKHWQGLVKLLIQD